MLFCRLAGLCNAVYFIITLMQKKKLNEPWSFSTFSTLSFPAAKAEKGELAPLNAPNPPKAGDAEGVVLAGTAAASLFEAPMVEAEPNFTPPAGVGVFVLREDKSPNADTFGVVEGVEEAAFINGESDGVAATEPNAPNPVAGLNPGVVEVFRFPNAPPVLVEEDPKGLDEPSVPNGEVDGVVGSGVAGVFDPPNGLACPRVPNGDAEGVLLSTLESGVAGVFGPPNGLAVPRLPNGDADGIVESDDLPGVCGTAEFPNGLAFPESPKGDAEGVDVSSLTGSGFEGVSGGVAGGDSGIFSSLCSTLIAGMLASLSVVFPNTGEELFDPKAGLGVSLLGLEVNAEGP